MASLGSHANVWNTCLALLHQKGYRVQVSLDPEDGPSHGWFAEKADFSFAADNPIELLGLVAIFEEVKPADDRPYWWHVSGEGPTRDQLFGDALDQRDAREAELERLHREAPEVWAQSIQRAMDNSGGVADAASQLGISAAALRAHLARLP
jgi:GrpB-like predicted nucleotidyltransferase (UPF0157 family)